MSSVSSDSSDRGGLAHGERWQFLRLHAEWPDCKVVGFTVRQTGEEKTGGRLVEVGGISKEIKRLWNV